VDGSTRSPAPGTPLYVHLPFCAAKCTYCDFFSVPAAGQDLEGALESVLAEARMRAPFAPRTLFLGGGTPSIYPSAALTDFLRELDAITGWRRSVREATVECNPESLDERKAEALLEAGIDRLSIGFQSLDPARLALFGRVHGVEQSFAAFRAARAAGFRRLSVDLIYAAPGQTDSTWRAELSRVLELEPDHLSAYNLTVEPGTAYERMHARGEVASLDDEEELAQFHSARELCSAAGLLSYEVSNYARIGQECLHNVNYWENGEYVGIGPSAVSKVGIERFGNPKSLASWKFVVRSAGAPAWREALGDDERLGETWWLGLRLARGLTPQDAKRRARYGAAAQPPDDAAEKPPEKRTEKRTEKPPEKRAAKPAETIGLRNDQRGHARPIASSTSARATPPARAASTTPTSAAPDRALSIADELVALGLLERDGDVPREHAVHRLSDRGLALADAVGRRFLVAPAR
jgi:oxygen-independent coproporphyrinogen III oxidase